MLRTRTSRSTPKILLLATVAALVAVTPVTADARPRSDALPPPAQVAPTPTDPLVIVVSLRRQRLTVFNRNGHVVDSPISSGTSEFPTPTGVFSVIGKEVEHESNIYEGAAMPFMQRLTWTGTAMHAGNLPGYPASHGCIRLPYAFSERLFGMTQINTRVIVTREDVAPQPITHANLFTPPAVAPSDGEPMATVVSSRVASLAGVSPAIAAPVPLGPNQLPLTPQAKARFAETAKLLDAIKQAERNRNDVWDKVKAANRTLSLARMELNSLQVTASDADAEAAKARKSKLAGEAQLAAIMRKAESARSAEALASLAKAEDAAEARLLDLSEKYDAALETAANLKTGLPALKAKMETADAARRALDDDLRKVNLALRDSQSAHQLAKRDDFRYMKPVSVFVSRKTQRLYVRQGFKPVLEVPVTIADPDQPLGTHVFTAMGVKDGGAALHWSVVSLGQPARVEDARRGRNNPGDQRTLGSSKALDRIQFPAEALAVITERVKPGSSLVVTDEGTSQYFGNGTDFAVAAR
jgi:hypothetical protein